MERVQRKKLVLKTVQELKKKQVRKMATVKRIFFLVNLVTVGINKMLPRKIIHQRAKLGMKMAGRTITPLEALRKM
ncbi:MAG: hypothetical protein Q4E70_03675 [Candidatus Saccharibacteria bacterium]|nr:hypothetical protein [Candidatus Saccharibacteria bacterium]